MRRNEFHDLVPGALVTGSQDRIGFLDADLAMLDSKHEVSDKETYLVIHPGDWYVYVMTQFGIRLTGKEYIVKVDK